ncbi:MAG: aldehyde ferredoxin oxidoreductase [Chloroflexi bacterium]|nr:aldehyde ferredoxin oxidoreductase [Chloroflexota bacterium]
MRKIIRVDMTHGAVRYEDVPQWDYPLGGRGLTSAIVASEVPPSCHPLGPDNKLVFAPGVVTGTAAPCSGRLSVGGKSPLTGGIKEANAGGLAGGKLARLDIGAIVVEGQAPDGKMRLLKVDQAGATLVEADDLAGKGMYRANRMLRRRFGRVAIIGCGPAGEMRMTGAGVSVNDMENGPGRYAGRGGLGAVLGAKGLKAIVIDDRGGRASPVDDRAAFRREIGKLRAALEASAVTSKALPTYGTAVCLNVMNEAGGLPTRNFSVGRFEGVSAVSGERLNEIITKVRAGKGMVGHRCHPGCIIRCSNVYPKPDGSAHVSCLEYESDWALGPNCGIDDLDVIAELIWLCNDLGLDTIETGATIAVAMEGGVLPFGDGKGAIKLLREVGRGSPLGRIIGNGCVFAARAFGVTRVPAVKGQAMPAYDPRAVKGLGVTYATSPMGADHTAGYTISREIFGIGGKVDPFATNKAELSRKFQSSAAFIDSTGYCLFITFATDASATGFEGVLGSINAMHGTSLTPEAAAEYGWRILKLEREFNQRAGFLKAHDRLPDFMVTEKLPPHNTVFDVPERELDAVFAV